MFLRRKFLKESPATELEDVCEHLPQMLTSRRGAGGLLSHYGLTDTGYRTPAEMLGGMTAEIRENLCLFEPRVQVTEIEEDYADNGRVRLNVYCRLKRTAEQLHFVLGGQGQLLRLGAPDGLQEGEDPCL